VPLKTPTPQLTDPKLMAAAQTYGSPRVTTAAVGQSLETGSKKGMIAAIMVLLVIGGGVGAYFMFKSDNEMKAGTPTAQNPEVPPVNAGMEPAMEPDMPAVMEPVMEPDMPAVMEAPLPAEININVVNVPKGATVLIDGKKMTLPVKLPGARGQHSLVITASGYEPFIKNIEYREDVHLVFDAPRIQKVTVNSMKPPVDGPMEKPMETPMETPMDMPSSMPVDVNRPDF